MPSRKHAQVRAMSVPDLGCVKAKPLKNDRRSYSSKAALGHQLAIAFNFKIELKNFILVAFQTFAFSHSQGQKLP
jgi:hypothetical protein